MTIRQPKKRRLIRSLGWLAGGGVLLLVLLPVWFPWVLTPVAKHYGLQFADYDRMGWTRFALTEVRGEWNGTQLKVQRVESGLPTIWLWRRFQPRTNNPPLVSMSNGQLVVGELRTPTRTETPGSTGRTLNQVTGIGRLLRRWVPVAELTNCAVLVASNRVVIPQAHWQSGQLQAVVQRPLGLHEDIELVARFGGDVPLKLSAACEAYAASVQAEFTRTDAGWSGTGELGWLTNHANLSAQFTTNSWWPTVAQVDFRNWQIPATIFKVDGYENLSVSATVNFVSNSFDVQASGVAQPTDAAAQRGFPVVNLSLGANGDPNGLNLHTLRIQSPLLNVELTNAVAVTWAGEARAEPAQLRAAADLAKLPGASLTGQIEGLVQVEPRGGRLPFVQFHFSTGPVNSGRLDAKAILLRGEFAPPLLKLAETRVDFADGSVVKADGTFDTETKHINEARWQVAGGFLTNLLPGFSYAELTASGEADGPLTNLTHRGEVAITTGRIAGMKPFDVKATWGGRQQQLTNASIQMTAGESTLSLGATADLDITERAVAATLNQLSLRRGKEALYALQKPSGIKFRTGNANTSEPPWTLGLDAFNWQSQRHSISADAELAWPVRGNATLSLTNVAFTDFADFVTADIANISLAELAVAARWSNGPVLSVISVAGSMTNDTGHVFELRGAVRTDESLTIEQLTLANGYTPTLSVTGSIPVRVLPERGAGLLVWDKAGSIAVAGSWQDDQAELLSVPLGKEDHLEISRPNLLVRMAGTPDQPAAALTLGAKKLAWFTETTNSPLPKLEDVQLQMEVRPNAIELKTLVAKLDGQPLAATGEWAFTEKDWRRLWTKKKLPDWDHAQGHLELNDAQVAAVAAYLPDMLSPEGRLSAALELKTGKHLAGVLSLTNAATRPMGMITPLRDIAASVRFAGTRAVLEDFHGQLGGQPIHADGFVSVSDLDGSHLNYEVNLHGTNVPLSRSAELLLRGDFEASLRGGSNGPPKISGNITLRDGLFVQTASALVWSGPVRPELRPPYFSVTNEPFAAWRLDLAVHGDRFLHARTPVFGGIISADFQLQGTLGDPLLTGDARINSGRLLFPFGSLTLDQGFASFTGNDPRGPELQINASGRNYRYEIRLEVKGPADGANVILSSTPPLASDEILLMLTAGEIPRSDFAFSNSDRVGRLGTFIGTDLLSRYLGSDPAKERLIFRSGESISGEGRLTYSVEYRLTDRWSIIGAYDEFNAFNADLKWRVLTR